MLLPPCQCCALQAHTSLGSASAHGCEPRLQAALTCRRLGMVCRKACASLCSRRGCFGFRRGSSTCCCKTAWRFFAFSSEPAKLAGQPASSGSLVLPISVACSMPHVQQVPGAVGRLRAAAACGMLGCMTVMTRVGCITLPECSSLQTLRGAVCLTASNAADRLRLHDGAAP